MTIIIAECKRCGKEFQLDLTRPRPCPYCGSHKYNEVNDDREKEDEE